MKATDLVLEHVINKKKITFHDDFAFLESLFYELGGTDDITVGKPVHFTKVKYVLNRLLRESYFSDAKLVPIYKENFLEGFKLKW